jgi:DNA-directed RNA polymerase specialized sigma24 family protein
MNTEYLFKQQTVEDFSKFYEEYNILSYDKFSTWLFTIAKNKTIREINLNKRTVYIL